MSESPPVRKDQTLTVLRVDIESAEWDLLVDCKKKGMFSYISQLLIEIHFTTTLMATVTSYRRMQQILDLISCKKTGTAGKIAPDEKENCMVFQLTLPSFLQRFPS